MTECQSGRSGRSRRSGQSHPTAWPVRHAKDVDHATTTTTTHYHFFGSLRKFLLAPVPACIWLSASLCLSVWQFRQMHMSMSIDQAARQSRACNRVRSSKYTRRRDSAAYKIICINNLIQKKKKSRKKNTKKLAKLCNEKKTRENWRNLGLASSRAL